MTDAPDRGPKNLTGRTLRPKPPGHVWAWIVIAIGVVLCMIVTLWVVEAGTTTVGALSGQESVHRVAQRFKERWSHVPGPPDRYRLDALSEMHAGRLDESMRLMSMAVALDPNDAQSWVRMVCLSALDSDAKLSLTFDERHDLLAALMATDSSIPGFRIAAWFNDNNPTATPMDSVTKENLQKCFGEAIQSTKPKTDHETLDTMPAVP